MLAPDSALVFLQQEHILYAAHDTVRTKLCNYCLNDYGMQDTEGITIALSAKLLHTMVSLL